MQLLPIRKKDSLDIFRIVSSKKVMQNIGDGKLWNNQKLTNFIIYNLQEQKMKHSERKNYYYRMVVDDKLIGIIGFYFLKNKWNLKVFIRNSQQGKGYFSQALKQLLKKLKEYQNEDKLYSQVHQQNIKMNEIMQKKYYYDKSFHINQFKVNQYIIFNRPYTYLVKSEYIKPEIINNVFKSRKNWIEWNSELSDNPDFLHLDGKYYYDKQYQKYQVLLKNIMNNKYNKAIEKSSLFYALKGKKYLPHNFNFNKTKHNIDTYKHLFVSNQPYIIKPDGGYAGDQIKVVTKLEELKYIYNTKYNNWSIQEYIINPVLIDECKFHMRVLFLRLENGTGYMFEQIPIYKAKKPFVLDNYEDNDIHVSHYQKTQEELYLNDLQKELNVKDIIKQIKIILNDINSIIKTFCYNETKHCYEMYGVDFMVANKNVVKLLEFNHKIGLKEFTDAKFNFNQILFNSELQVVCDKYFPPLERTDESDIQFIQL